MKKIIPVLLCIVCFTAACRHTIAEKPDDLIEQEEMVDILYDIAVLQAFKSYNPKILDDNNINSETYIYKKYGIDSLTFADNHKYYAADLANYEKIQKEVSERLKNRKTELDSLIKKEEPKKPEIKARPLNDSLIKAKQAASGNQPQG
ncbi:DUF4296 domain-containing protein [Flavobacterium sp. MK4S-17]|uniref:DUF4296 domain-containing protein n=1 Tax=Flavobacterium sp. MK4S-17 TaxID=2543737 RepID=UPI00135C2043|nr:DUF4296 domain-containing protein [Flavobacterium sp. MK4S-17]